MREFQRSGASWSFAQSTTLFSDISPGAVDVDGEWMVLGDWDAELQGVVRVYRRVNGVWQHFQELHLPHVWMGFSEYWGFCVDVDGNRIAVGNPVDAKYRAAVYVFRRSAAFWSLEGIAAAQIAEFGNSGCGVALRGNELLVSSRTKVECHRFIPASGRWVFQYDVVSGLNGSSVLSRIPLAVTNDGVALVGDPYDDTVWSDAGAVHVLERVGGVWGARAKLFSTTPLAGAQFGYSVACRGPLLAAGAPGANTAELIVRNLGWQSAAVVTASDSQPGDRFGDAVAIATTATNLAPRCWSTRPNTTRAARTRAPRTSSRSRTAPRCTALRRSIRCVVCRAWTSAAFRARRVRRRSRSSPAPCSTSATACSSTDCRAPQQRRSKAD